jgi:hypothetical protein
MIFRGPCHSSKAAGMPYHIFLVFCGSLEGHCNVGGARQDFTLSALRGTNPFSRVQSSRFFSSFMNEVILVTGAGGFIGGHLVGRLLQEGQRVRAVDKKPQWQWYQRLPIRGESDRRSLDGPTFGPASTTRNTSLPHRSRTEPNKSSSDTMNVSTIV